MKAGSRRVAKRAYTCMDGPFKGHTLYLASAPTAYLNVDYSHTDIKGIAMVTVRRKETGRYEKVPGRQTQLIWKIK